MHCVSQSSHWVATIKVVILPAGQLRPQGRGAVPTLLAWGLFLLLRLCPDQDGPASTKKTFAPCQSRSPVINMTEYLLLDHATSGLGIGPSGKSGCDTAGTGRVGAASETSTTC